MFFDKFRKSKAAMPGNDAPAIDVSAPDTLEDVILTDTVERVEEEAIVSKRAVEGDTLRVQLQTETTTHPVALPLRREHYEVERVAIDRVVDTIPEVRKENGVTIVPVLEERLVVTKQLVLREEIHIRSDHTVVEHEDEIELRTQTATIEREPAG